MSLGDKMKTIRITPRGLCHGVVGAINTITKLDHLSTRKPIYILGMLVHNKQVVESFKEKGIITLHDPSRSRIDLLDDINEGTVIFTAHGISPSVKEKALNKGLDIIDTTCGDVTKTQVVIKDYLAKDFSIIYIGKHDHPESEAAQGIDKRVHLIENVTDIEKLKLEGNIAVTNQTTMSLYDVYNLSQIIKKKYPDSIFIDEICNATRIRQEAVMNQEQVDHCFVVGDKLSNNSQKLVQVSKEQSKIDATLIETIHDIDIEKLKTYNSVSVSSGASTPTRTTRDVIIFLEAFDKDNPSTHIIK